MPSIVAMIVIIRGVIVSVIIGMTRLDMRVVVVVGLTRVIRMVPAMATPVMPFVRVVVVLFGADSGLMMRRRVLRVLPHHQGAQPSERYCAEQSRSCICARDIAEGYGEAGVSRGHGRIQPAL